MEVDPKQLKMGIKVEKEHAKTITGNKKVKTRKIALDHLKEIPDYYTRLKKMEKEAGVKEAWVDPIEVLHNATMARIRKGAKEGKYWLLRSEGVGERTMQEQARKELIDRILETTTTANIGGYNKGMAGDAMTGSAGAKRNKLTKDLLRFAADGLLGRRSSPVKVT